MVDATFDTPDQSSISAAPEPAPTDTRRTTPTPSPDAPEIGRQGWLFLIALAAIAGLAELAIVIINLSTLPVFLDRGLHLPQLVGISFSVFYLCEALGNSPMGALSDRLGRRPLMVAGALISMTTCLLMSSLRLPPGGSVLLVSAAVLALRAVDGLGAAMYWPALFASVGDKLHSERQAQGMSVLNVTYLVGIAFGPVIGGICNENLGREFSLNQAERYVPSFLVAATCFAVIALVSAFIAPKKQPQSLSSAGSHGVENPHSGTPLNAIKRAVREIPFVLLMGFLVFFSTAGLIPPYLKSFVMDRFDLSESGFGTMMLYPAVVIGALSFPLGHLCDRIGKARAIQIGLGIVAGALWLLLMVQQFWAGVAVGSLLGIGFILCFPSYMAYISERAGAEERAGMIGAARMAQGIGALSGATLSSFLYHADSRHLTIFVCAAALVSVGWLLSLFVIHPLKPGTSPSAPPTTGGDA
ncbi:MAG: tetracycline efflux MFS transporter Tet(30) [Armatimonadaceae bacterium]